MEVKIEREDLLALAQEYNFDFSTVVKWYTEFIALPLVQGGTDDQLYEAFEAFLQDRTSSDFLAQYPERDLKGRTEDESMYEALYRTYGEEALDSIPDDYAMLMGWTDQPTL